MTTMTTTAPNFAPTFGAGPLNLDQRLQAAYTLAGLTPPALAVRAEEALRDEPTPKDVGIRVAAESLEAPDSWLEDSIAAMTRALAVERIREDTRRYREHTLRLAGARYSTQAATDLAPFFAKVARALTKAATDLPHDAPLDPTAVVDTDTTRPWKAARQALAQLGTLASIHEQRDAAHVGMNSASLLRVVEPPPITEAQPIHRLTRDPLGEVDPRRTQVIEWQRVAEREGVDLALVRIARGDWPALSLSLAASPADLAQRAEHLRKATSQLVDPDRKRVVVR